MISQNGNFPLESRKSGETAYVGLREENGKVTLRVPYGYPTDDKPPVLESHEKQNILGELTRVLMRFSEAFVKTKRSAHDGFHVADGGQSFGFDSDDHSPSYAHLSRYIRLIRMLRDPRLMSIIKTPGLTAQFDHRYISRNLERAMFLPDGTPVFDLSWAPRAQMRHTGNDMAGLACWMALDALNRLFPNSAGHEIGATLQSEWEELAHRFEEEHELGADTSLFSGRRKDVLPLLQAALENCVRFAPPVASDARELYHLLDELLHHAINGQDGDIWGLQGFHHVWESACLEYAVQEYGLDKVCICDHTYWLERVPPKWITNWEGIFAGNGLVRRPDLVVKKADGTYLIVDFKYYAADEAKDKFAEVPSPPSLELLKAEPAKFEQQWKSYQDVASVEAYRWRLMQYELESSNASKVEIEFWVPDVDFSDEAGSKYPCPWMDGLTLVGKPARKILHAYSSKFRLMD